MRLRAVYCRVCGTVGAVVCCGASVPNRVRCDECGAVSALKPGTMHLFCQGCVDLWIARWTRH